MLGGAERLIAGAVVTGGAAIAREAMRRRREGHEEVAEQEDSTQSAPETGPSAVPLIREVSDGRPNHYVGPEGTTIGSVVSGSPPSADLAGQVVRKVEDSESGWTLIECLNGARCWVDPAGLNAFSAPDPQPVAPEPAQAQAPGSPENVVLHWFSVDAGIAVQLSDGTVVGQLQPGTWFAAHEEAGGWT
ncbi:MAG: hypothetical protein GY773_30630, partial [Actinomycetia bacterium]|nr:hypothetical protein [Actinomycetes bacterium]